MSECLDPNAAAGLVDDSLSAADRDSAETHIADCASCRRLIAELARSHDDQPEDEQPVDEQPVIGSEIGRYELRGFRGSGGMGAVYEAFDPKLDRLVALKLVKPTGDGSGTGGRGRVLREAHALAKLAHPNIVPVFDVGDFGDDIFIAMELVDGHTLRAWLKEAPRTDEEIIEVFRAAGRGLAAAHERGMVHRDFKPENVLVDDEGRARVVDFGLVRAAGESDEASNLARISPVEEMTRTGTVVGTPAYMAPEQLLGAAVDQRADQFSFAVSLYEALYDERPFAGDTLEEVARAAAGGEVRSPPAGSKVSRRIRELLLRALAAKPEDRFETIDELLDRLAPPRRGWLPLAIAAGLLVAFAAVSFAWLTLTSGPTPCATSEELAADIWNPSVADAAIASIASAGHPAPDDASSRIVSRMEKYRKDWLELHHRACRATHIDKTQPQAHFERQLICLFDRRERARAVRAGLDATLTAKAVDELISATSKLPSIDDCERAAEQSAAPLPPADLRESVAAIRASISRATAELDMGRESSFTVAEGILERAKAVDFVPLTAEAMHLLGRLHLAQANNKTAETVLREAISLAASENHDSLLAALWVELTLALFEQGKYNDAITLAPVVEAALVRADSDARQRARGLHAIGEAYWWQPDYERALKMMLEAAELIEKTYGQDDPDLPYALAMVAEALIDNDREDEALTVAGRAAERAERAYGRDHSLTAWTDAIRGMSLRALGRYAEAKATLTDAKARLVSIAGSHPDILWLDRELGNAHHGLGHYEAAVRAHQYAADATAEAYGDNDYRVSLHLKNVARAEAARGRRDAARATLDRALEIRLISRGTNHPTTAEIHRRIGELEAKRGDHKEALSAFERAIAIYQSAGDREGLGVARANQALVLYETARTRSRAVEIAKAALDDLVASGDSEGAAQVRAWLEGK